MYLSHCQRCKTIIMFNIFRVLLVVNILILGVTPYYVIDHTDLDDYVGNVTQNYIFEVERLGSWNLSVPDFTQKINKSLYGYDVFGYVNFTNGRMGYLGDAVIDHYKTSYNFESRTRASVSWMWSLNNKRIYFDYCAKLSVDTFQGIVAFNITNLDVELKVMKDFTSDMLYPSLSYWDTTVPYYKIFMTAVPTNKYLQIIAMDNSYDPIRDILLLEKKVLNNTFQEAVSKIPFPEIRFNRV